MLKYSILQINKVTETIIEIVDKTAIKCSLSNDTMQALEYLMDHTVNLIVIHTNIELANIIHFLEIMNDDIENKNTPVILISDLVDNDALADATKNYNVISILTYKNYIYQLMNLFKILKFHNFRKETLKKELSLSETRNVIDPLTGALNRYGAEDVFVKLTARTKAYDEPFCMIMLDIDHFKKVNDTYGHDIGDEVLISLVNTIRSHKREHDAFIRFGGEEFFIFLSNVRLNMAITIANKFRTHIKKMLHTSIKLSITASFGVVEYTNNEEFNSLIKRVDLLLYKAKDEGRDRVISSL